MSSFCFHEIYLAFLSYFREKIDERVSKNPTCFEFPLLAAIQIYNSDPND